MNEIEVKVLEVDVEAVEKKLRALGAQKIFDGEVAWSVFDFPDKRFSEKEILIRSRKLGQKTQLTIKRLLNTHHAKVSEETEIETSDYEMTNKILRIIGLEPKKGYPLVKHRVSYTLEEVHFELDTFLQLPTYLEIEAPSQIVINQYLRKLGFSSTDAKPWGTREVFAYYRNRIK